MNPHHYIDPREPFEEVCHVCDGEGFLVNTIADCIKRCEACGAFDTDESARQYVEGHSADLQRTAVDGSHYPIVIFHVPSDGHRPYHVIDQANQKTLGVYETLEDAQDATGVDHNGR